MKVHVETSAYKKNSETAVKNRKVLDDHGITAIDVLGPVGSGKTLLIEKLSVLLKDSGQKVGVIAGDLATTTDRDRILQHGIPSVQINTERQCHLDAMLILQTLADMNVTDLDILFIENVGNAICPVAWELGAHKRLLVMALTTGSHFPQKHPLLIKSVHFAAINKIDIAEILEVDPMEMEANTRQLNAVVQIFHTSAKLGTGLIDLNEAMFNKRIA